MRHVHAFIETQYRKKVLTCSHTKVMCINCFVIPNLWPVHHVHAFIEIHYRKLEVLTCSYTKVNAYYLFCHT